MGKEQFMNLFFDNLKSEIAYFEMVYSERPKKILINNDLYFSILDYYIREYNFVQNTPDANIFGIKVEQTVTNKDKLFQLI